MWTTELLTRYGYTLMIIYKNGETVGSLQFLEDSKEDIDKWTKLVESLNESPRV